MRVVLLGSSIPNMLNYGLHFSSFGHHEFITTLLVPKVVRRAYQERIMEFRKTPEGKNLLVYPIFLNLQHNRLRNLLNIPHALKDFSSIFKTLKHLTPDVVICYYVMDAYPFILLKKILKYSLYVVAIGSDINLNEGFFDRSLRKLIYQGSDLIFAVSHALRDKIESESGHQPIVARTGVDEKFFRPLNSRRVLRKKWGFSRKDQVLLTVCNLVKHKGVDHAIKALRILTKERSSTKLVIVGGGPEKRSLERLASKLRLRSKVVFLGIRNRQELLELYNAADVFVLASLSEGMPFVLLEAMACGCVCVATKVGDIPTVITSGKNGFLVPSKNPVALAETINDAFSLSREAIHSIEYEARKIVEKSFNYGFSVSTMIKAIECGKESFTSTSRASTCAPARG